MANHSATKKDVSKNKAANLKSKLAKHVAVKQVVKKK